MFWLYFVASVFTACSSFGFISKFVQFGEFLSVLSYHISLRPTHLPVYVHDCVYLYFLFITVSFYFSPLFAPPSFYPSPLYPLFHVLKCKKTSPTERTTMRQLICTEDGTDEWYRCDRCFADRIMRRRFPSYLEHFPTISEHFYWFSASFQKCITDQRTDGRSLL